MVDLVQAGLGLPLASRAVTASERFFEVCAGVDWDWEASWTSESIESTPLEVMKGEARVKDVFLTK